MAPAAISEILERSPRRSLRSLPAVCALGCVLLLASEAAAERISLLGFEGDSATALRWRVAQILKRAGHTVLGLSPPQNPDSASELRAYADRKRVVAFVGGTSVESPDGWELSLFVRDADGQSMGRQLTFTANTLGNLVRELKSDGQGQLDRVVRGRSSGADADVELERAPAADLAGNLKASAAKKRAKRRKRRGSGKARRAVEVALDADAPAEPASEPTAINLDSGADEGAAASSDFGEAGSDSGQGASWTESDSSSSEDASSDDGDPAEEESSSLLSRDADGAFEVGADEASEGDPASGKEHPTVVLGVNAGLVRRTLTYVDDLYGRLRAPSVNTWVYQLNAAVYPFAQPVKDRIGLIASYESVISGVVRDNTAGTDFPVAFSELFGGVRLRQPLGVHEVALQLGAGTMAAGLEDSEGLSGVPEFNYTLLRSSVDLGLHFGPVSMRGAVGYRLSLGGYGEVSEAEWFPRMEGNGLEGMLGIQYRLSKEVAFDISGSMRRFVLTMNSQPEDAREGVAEVAGGAVDLYMSGYFGLNITL